jgi:ribosomal protein S18 acetylase RimI-like enzyme
MSSIQIRPMAEADVESCAEIGARTRLFARQGMTPESALRTLSAALTDPASDLRVALREGRLVGFCWVARNGAFCRSDFLRWIAVDPSAQGAGIGRRLVAAALEATSGDQGLFALVPAGGSDGAAFFEALGFARVGTIADYPRSGTAEDLYFKKTIPPA